MILKFATKRNTNGNRYFVGINTQSREYSRISHNWFCRDDFIEVSYKDLHKIIQQCKDSGFSEISYI